MKLLIPTQPQSGMPHLHPDLTPHLQPSRQKLSLLSLLFPTLPQPLALRLFLSFQSVVSQQSILTLSQQFCCRLPLVTSHSTHTESRELRTQQHSSIPMVNQRLSQSTIHSPTSTTRGRKVHSELYGRMYDGGKNVG